MEQDDHSKAENAPQTEAKPQAPQESVPQTEKAAAPPQGVKRAAPKKPGAPVGRPKLSEDRFKQAGVAPPVKRDYGSKKQWIVVGALGFVLLVILVMGRLHHKPHAPATNAAAPNTPSAATGIIIHGEPPPLPDVQ